MKPTIILLLTLLLFSVVQAQDKYVDDVYGTPLSSDSDYVITNAGDTVLGPVTSVLFKKIRIRIAGSPAVSFNEDDVKEYKQGSTTRVRKDILQRNKVSNRLITLLISGSLNLYFEPGQAGAPVMGGGGTMVMGGGSSPLYYIERKGSSEPLIHINSLLFDSGKSMTRAQNLLASLMMKEPDLLKQVEDAQGYYTIKKLKKWVTAYNAKHVLP